ncbi:MAG: hypothetical protein MO852_04665 [Candidatus Devosia euplotis]|nr:hypothetical protein [Candidatus Devosia euplotis]
MTDRGELNAAFGAQSKAAQVHIVVGLDAQLPAAGILLDPGAGRRLTGQIAPAVTDIKAFPVCCEGGRIHGAGAAVPAQIGGVDS